ncbi:mitochondrial pyruvate carrier [Coleophoma crateriformis]|uniref:Mitochondrial pyruvate carrier n=1 Tax=Coleophoma crateriformis TaxID=565419 RepID=A0A3D8T1T7_9HELO|nr:mitochondrial pyruvate carrier [Coleophoma crateriformis]
MPPSTVFRAARPVFRSSQFFTQQAYRTQGGRVAGRRCQSTASQATEAAPGLFKRMWESPVGFKTVHFWAPVMKWALVLAGIADLTRPAEKLSLTQNAALTATGIIWTRWCLIIKPRNILLATVNFFLGCVGVAQVTRILLWRRSPEGKAALQLEAAQQSAVDTAKDVKGKVEDVIKA